MFRTCDTMLVIMMIAGAAFTYKTKHDAEKRLQEVRKLHIAIEHEEDVIALLKADWAVLIQPERLQRLTDLYQEELGLYSAEPYQTVESYDLPGKQRILHDIFRSPWEAYRRDDRFSSGGISP